MLQFNLPNSFFFYIVTPIIGFNYGYPKPRYKNDRFIYLSLWSLHATRSLVEFQKLNSRRTDKHILPKTRRQTRANGVVSSACSCRLWSTGRLSFVKYEPSTVHYSFFSQFYLFVSNCVDMESTVNGMDCFKSFIDLHKFQLQSSSVPEVGYTPIIQFRLL